MHHFSPQAKDAILREYVPNDVNHGFTALARRHPPLTANTIRRWRDQWDGTPDSLEEGERAGRPPVIEPEDRVPVIERVIGQANRHHEAIHYPEVADELNGETGIRASLRSVRRWGQQLGVRQMRTIPRSEDERR